MGKRCVNVHVVNRCPCFPPPEALPDGYAVTFDQMLILFSLSRPDAEERALPIRGLEDGEVVVGIDFRSMDQNLFALGYHPISSSGRLYTLNQATARALPVGPRFPLNGSSFGFTNNPDTDLFRVVTNTGLNYVVHPNTGLATAQSVLNYPPGDPGFGTIPLIVASSHTDPAGTIPSVLYDIDAARNTLVRQAPPASGKLQTVGPLGIELSSTSPFQSFDIRRRDNAAYAILTKDSNRSGLYRIDLNTGEAVLLRITSSGIRGLAIFP